MDQEKISFGNTGIICTLTKEKHWNDFDKILVQQSKINVDLPIKKKLMLILKSDLNIRASVLRTLKLHIYMCHFVNEV